MIVVLSREQMRTFDQFAIQDCKVPSLVLMENAGRGAADVIEREQSRVARRATAGVSVGNDGLRGEPRRTQGWRR